MSLFDAIMTGAILARAVVQAVACDMGLHRWSPWEYQREHDKDCTQVRKCVRCGRLDSHKLVKHKPSDWIYAKETGCEQNKTCTRCERILESRIQHMPADWAYTEASEDCTKIKSCSRCKAALEQKIEHQMGEWHYPEVGHCRFVSQCARCPKFEERVEHKVWTGWEPFRPCEEVSKCDQCGEPRYRKLPHPWSKWDYDGPTSCNQMRSCPKCHAREDKPATKDEDHQGWTDWVYASPNRCDIFEQHCVRCKSKKTKTTSPVHELGDWKPYSATQERAFCKRCSSNVWRRLQPRP